MCRLKDPFCEIQGWKISFFLKTLFRAIFAGLIILCIPGIIFIVCIVVGFRRITGVLKKHWSIKNIL